MTNQINAIKSIDYIVRDWRAGYCIIESMRLEDGKLYQRGIKYGLTQDDAQNMADNLQAHFDYFGHRPTPN
jgi:hypothetical protein